MTRFGSVCSGIEAASVAWYPLGMSAAWLSEIEPFPCAVLAHHWPAVVNLGDMTVIPAMLRTGALEAPAVLVGGTPCQAFSVAGLQGGMDDPRGQLTLTYVDILNAIDEQRDDGDEAVCVWENVPGVLSDAGNAFGCFLGKLAGSELELQPGEPPAVGKSAPCWRWDKKRRAHVARWPNAGYIVGPQRTIAWRILDAQYFGVAQRRKRVFVVASARDGFDPREVLFEREGVRRDTPPSREAGQGSAGYAISGIAEYRENLGTLRAKGGDLGGGSEVLTVHGTQDPVTDVDRAFALGRNNGSENAVLNVAYPGCTAGDAHPTLETTSHDYSQADGFTVVGTLCAGTMSSTGARDVEDGAIQPHADRVRKLMPPECETLQGFPPGHTAVPYRNKPASDCPDGPRYRAIGNSKAVPVVQWVGKRLIKEIERCEN